jgi:hypothetical protein
MMFTDKCGQIYLHRFYLEIQLQMFSDNSFAPAGRAHSPDRDVAYLPPARRHGNPTEIPTVVVLPCLAWRSSGKEDQREETGRHGIFASFV